jgi:predicted RNA-binding Zn ribbon-like protein
MRVCPGIKRDGSRCTVTVEPPQTYCWWHDPDNAEQRKQAASRGGKRAGRGRPMVELANVKERLSTLADDVLAGTVDRSDASVTSQILNVYLRAITVEMKVKEVEKLEERITALEQAKAQERSWTYP